MSLTGWLTMIVSIGGVLTAAAWASYKVLSTPKETEHLGSPTPPMPEDPEEEGSGPAHEQFPVRGNCPDLSCPSGDCRSPPRPPR